LTSEEPDTISSDSSDVESVNEDRELIELDLPDSLLQLPEQDTAPAIPDSVQIF